jgi:hypothetical protein
MLQKIREWLSLLLIGLLPFHAFLVTASTRLIAGPDQAPLSQLAVWKEGLLGLILLIAFIEIARKLKDGSLKLKADYVNVIILSLITLSIAVTLVTHNDWKLYLFGFRYDFVPLVAFLFARRVDWSVEFIPRVRAVILSVGAVIAAYALASFVLPVSFFHALGYSDMHSLYLPDKPIAAFQMIGGTALRRIQGTFSGPNHLGIWLLIPLGIVLMRLQAERLRSRTLPLNVALLLLFGITLLLTFSRAAWIGAFVMLCIAVAPFVRHLPRRVSLGIASLILAIVAIAASLYPSVIIRISSTRGHIEGPIAAVQKMIAAPIGEGMGMAGPASNRVSETCVLLREQDDPTWWTENRPEMCVFVGDAQVQPSGRACNCPFLPENWYLQMGVELGILGLILYIVLILGVIGKLKILNFHFSIFISFIGVSIVALFLHAWEDAATAYTLWLLAAVCVGQKTDRS